MYIEWFYDYNEQLAVNSNIYTYNTTYSHRDIVWVNSQLLNKGLFFFPSNFNISRHKIFGFPLFVPNRRKYYCLSVFENACTVGIYQFDTNILIVETLSEQLLLPKIKKLNNFYILYTCWYICALACQYIQFDFIYVQFPLFAYFPYYRGYIIYIIGSLYTNKLMIGLIYSKTKNLNASLMNVHQMEPQKATNVFVGTENMPRWFGWTWMYDPWHFEKWQLEHREYWNTSRRKNYRSVHIAIMSPIHQVIDPGLLGHVGRNSYMLSKLVPTKVGFQ